MDENNDNAVENGKQRRPEVDFLSGLIVFLIAVYALYESVSMPLFGEGEARVLSSPGLTPGLLSFGLMFMAGMLMWRGRKFSLSFNISRPSIETWRMFIALLIVIGYVILLKPLGYAFSTFLMMATFQTVFARRRAPKYILVWCVGLSAVVTAILYYVFANVFLIPLP